jgi:hypothetical protein
MMRVLKDPDAILDYAVDWEAWLGTDTIASVAWTVPAGLTLDAQSHTDTVATVWLSGGTAGQSYALGCAVTTAGGRVDERTLTIVVVER